MVLIELLVFKMKEDRMSYEWSRFGFASAAAALLLLTPIAGGQAWAVDAPTAQVLAKKWIVSADEAKALIAQGAVVLDNRDASLRKKELLPNAVALEWPQLTYPNVPAKGKLLDDDAALTKVLQQAGVSKDKPVINIADPINGWGEDGRLTWALRTLGDTEAVFVDGGYEALVKDGAPQIAAPKIPGDFVVARTKDWEVKRDDVKADIGKAGVVIIDAREDREYSGGTPYGESRGGHVPGAKHVWFKDLIGKDGHLLTKEQLAEKLKALGVDQSTQVDAYCTGGIRSGFLTATLTNAGYKVKNYAGSMWDWASGDAKQYPLEK
jgi:thiosulfate/3-mercaptopyruvate sulfurtransferase